MRGENKLSSHPVRKSPERKLDINHDLQKKPVQKKYSKKVKMARLRFFIIMFTFLSLIIPKICYETYDYLFLRKIVNSSIKVPDDLFANNNVENLFANDYFLGKEFLSSVSFDNPEMKRPVLKQEMPKITNNLKYLMRQYNSITPGIFVWDYSTGKYVNINADEEFPTASMIKIPILFQLFRRVELGLVNLSEKMTLTDYFVTGGSGKLQYRPVGSTFRIYNLAQLMVQESDNTATNMLLSTVGGVDDLNRVLRLWGFSNTHMSNWLPDLDGTNVATPMDFGTMLFNIDNTNFLSLKSRAAIVDIMSHVKNRHLIQAGLPDNVQFIHKTGDIGNMLGDAGIVILPDGRKYIIVIMVKRPWNSFGAKEFIINASKTVYNSYITHNL